MRHFLLLLLYSSHLLGVSPGVTKPKEVVQSQNANGYNKKVPRYQIEADLLCWVPEVSGLDINFGSGSAIQTTAGGNTITVSKETDTDPSLNWNVGYRISAGWHPDCSRWHVGGWWTDFHGSGHKAVDQGKWNVRLYQLDLVALYDNCWDSFTLQPFCGLRGASILQKLFSQITTPILFPGTGTAIDTRTLNDREQFYGLGPLFGLNGQWALKYGLGLYGNIAFSLLYGNYHLHFHDTEVLTAPATPSQIDSTINKALHAFDFDVDLGLGVQWQRLLRNACCLTLKLGLENHQYFNQSRLGNSIGNLSFSGGVFSFRLAF